MVAETLGEGADRFALKTCGVRPVDEQAVRTLRGDLLFELLVLGWSQHTATVRTTYDVVVLDIGLHCFCCFGIELDSFHFDIIMNRILKMQECGDGLV